MGTNLAIDGGTPVRGSWLPYGRQSLNETDKRAVVEVLNSSFITRGPKVAEFEKRIAEFCQMPFAVAFSSATAGLHAAMALFGIGPGKTVGVAPITFAATANAVLYCGGQVEFVDVEEDTFNLDPKKFADHSKLDALACVDFAGNPCRYSEIRSQIPIVADAAHSLGGFYQNKPVGSLTECSVLSFHPVKSMTTGEGGAVLVRDEEQARFLRQFRNHGIEKEERPGYLPQKSLGYNYHMTDIQAALGVSQLARLEEFISKRRAIAEFYFSVFKDQDLFVLPKETPEAQSSWHLFPIRLNLQRLKVDRDQVLKALRAENIGVQVHYMPVYWHPYYQSLGFQKVQSSLPVQPEFLISGISAFNPSTDMKKCNLIWK